MRFHAPLFPKSVKLNTHSHHTLIQAMTQLSVTVELSNGNLKPTLIKPEQLRKPGGNFRFQSQHPELFHVLLVELIALKTCWALFFLFPAFLFPLSEKSTTSNKNPSKPPVISVPPKAPEDKTPNTHFGVVIHDRGRCRHSLRMSTKSCLVAAAAELCADNDCGMFLRKLWGFLSCR